MTQRTFTVDHSGRGEASEKQMLTALRSSLSEEDLVLVGDPKILSFTNEGGVSTKYTVELTTRKSKSADTPDSDPPDGDEE